MLILVFNCCDGDNFDLAVASSSKRKRPSVKTAYIRFFEEFAIDYNLTAHILIRYGQNSIAQWEINTKRKRKRAKDHLPYVILTL